MICLLYLRWPEGPFWDRQMTQWPYPFIVSLYFYTVCFSLTINARYLLDLFGYCLEIAKYLDTSVLYWAWYWIWKIWVLILVLLLSLDFWGIDIDIGIPFQILRYWNWYWYWIKKLLVLVFLLILKLLAPVLIKVL